MIIDYMIGARRLGLLLLVVVGLLAAGCGGSGGSANIATTPMSLTVNWPDRGRAVTPPASALSARIVVRGALADGGNLEFIANRNTNDAAHSETYTSAQSGTPGTRTIETRFYADPNGTGSLVGEATFSTVISFDGRIAVTVTVDSKIETVEVAANQHVWARKPKALVATAFDAQHAAIVVQPDAFKWAIAAGGDHLRFEGNQAEGLLAGNATVTASVDSKTSNPTDVEVRATVEFVAIPKAGTGPGGFGLFVPKLVTKDGITVVGTLYDFSLGARIPARWNQAGDPTPLPGYQHSTNVEPFPWGANADGSVVVGYRQGTEANSVRQAWVWRNGELTALTPAEAGRNMFALWVSDSGDLVCGYQSTILGTRGFTVDPTNQVEEVSLPAEATESAAFRVSGDGSRMVGSVKVNGLWRAAYWVNGVPQILPTDANRTSRARAISGDGQVVYASYEDNNIFQAFRWTAATGIQMIDTPEFLVWDTSGTGDIGVGFPPGGQVASIYTPQDGLETMSAYVERKFGFRLSTLSYRGAQSMSTDGRTIMGVWGDSGWLLRPVATD